MVYIKKQIISGTAVIACVASYAALCPRSAEVRDLPAEPVKAAVSAEAKAQPEETPYIFVSVDSHAPDVAAVTEGEPSRTEVPAEKEPGKPAPTQTTQSAKRYTEICELMPEILRLFISRIEVGERGEKYSRTAEQEIRIVYRDVGVMDSVEQVGEDPENMKQANIA